MGTTSELKSWLKRYLSDSNEASWDESPILRWELDYPSSLREPRFTGAGRIVQGWVLLQHTQAHLLSNIRIVAAWTTNFELCHPLEIERPDVIERVLKAKSDVHPQRFCGFRFTIPRHISDFALWLECGKQRWLLQEVSVDGVATLESPAILKVLEGKSGWLFLDNDTNGSVDQYRGRLRLTTAGLATWQAYLARFHAIAERVGARSAMLVAPSKESVMGPHYHPCDEGSGGPISQLLGLPEANQLVYPVRELNALGDSAFIQNDSHWAQRGAMQATCALASALGLDDEAVKAVFAKDTYQPRTLVGDLGNKFSPQRTCEIQALRSFNYNRYRHFDNGLPNFGRLLVLVYPKALLTSTCLIFGSSSSYSMFNYLSRLFQRVVFVHSAGSLDPELVEAVRPEFLVVQTNARFVVQIPKVKQPLEALVADKRARLTPEEQALVAERRVDVDKEDATITSLGLVPWVVSK
ncbi:alginate O-acetyltransferase AlgX-related protein [Halomonas dongshanensis]|uniref:AlgX/AlgJ SGNH hydrolase-like domain-containing protein n=1 Tax=Halomonas dongshanensis TaxID=2890835 RepID=A0ABT2EC37_9GAMM|nr:hypothetical protein [Halomonas dongshanensis]MCS2609147.1 hypothetical protein [Halomonas dongshanensis]